MARQRADIRTYPSEFWDLFDRIVAGERITLSFESPGVTASMRTRLYAFLSSILHSQTRILAGKAPELSPEWQKRILEAADHAGQVTTTLAPDRFSFVVSLRTYSPEALRLRAALSAETTIGLPPRVTAAERDTAETGPLPSPEMLRLAGLRRGGIE